MFRAHLLVLAGLPALTAALVPARGSLSLSTVILAFLLVVLAAALAGGLGPAVLAAVGGILLLNYYFTPPLHTLAVSSPSNLLALVAFVIVGVAVSAVVDRAERRRREAAALVALLSAAGHDLRSPLASAVAAVDGLHLALPAADRAELLDTAGVSLGRLGALVENLLDLSRLRVGGLPVALEPTSVAEVVAAARGELDGEVLVDLPDDLPELVADPVLLQRVVVNLLTNALRHSPAGRPPAVTAAAAGRRVLLRVVDHGPGVPAAEQARMFEAFQPSRSGIGLGLALSKGLTEAMSGRLTPSTTPGGGLTMTLALRSVG